MADEKIIPENGNTLPEEQVVENTVAEEAPAVTENTEITEEAIAPEVAESPAEEQAEEQAEIAEAVAEESAEEPAAEAEEPAAVEEAPVEEKISEDATAEEAPAEEVAGEEESAPAEEAAAEDIAEVADDAKAEAVAEAGKTESGSISEKLWEAVGNISRASADADARRADKEKSRERAEDAEKARAEAAEKQRAEEERIAEAIAAEKLAALEYAENYRDKLRREKEKSINAAKLREKEEKEREAERLREERAKEIAEVLERERAEARARSERAEQLIERHRRTEDESAGEDVAEEPVAVAEEQVAPAEAQTEPAEAEDEKIIIEIDHDEPVTIYGIALAEEKPAPEQAAAPVAQPEAVAEVAPEEDKDVLITEVRELDSDEQTEGGFEFAIIPEIPVEEEETVAEPAVPVIAEEPVVDPEPAKEEAEAVEAQPTTPRYNKKDLYATAKAMLEGVTDEISFNKYLAVAAKAVKKLDKESDRLYKKALSADEREGAALVIECVTLAGKSVDIRCDVLTVAANFAPKKLLMKQKKLLSDSIAGYNEYAADYAGRTGEQLARLSTFLPDYIAAATGAALIPELSYRERYVEVYEKGEADGNTLSLEAESKNLLATTTLLKLSVSDEKLLGNISVSDKKGVAKYFKSARNAYQTIDAQIKKLEKKRDGKRVSDKDRTMLYMQTVAAKKKKLAIALDVLSLACEHEHKKLIDDIRGDALELIGAYNLAVSECATLTGVNLSRVDQRVCDDILCGQGYKPLSLIAYRRELIERIGDRDRILGYSKKSAEPDNGVNVVEQERQIVEEGDSGVSDADIAAVNARELAKHLRKSAKEREVTVKELTSLRNAKNASDGATRVEIIVKCLACEKTLVDGLCADLAAVVQHGDKKTSKKLAKALESEILGYNLLVEEYTRLTGGKLSEASPTITSCVLEGKPYPQIPHVVCKVADTAYDRANEKKIDRGELNKYIAAGDREMASVRNRLATHVKERDAQTGKNRIVPIIKCLGCEKSLIDKLCDQLLMATRAKEDKVIDQRRKLLLAEIATYNKLIDEYASITGSRLTYAAKSIPDDIIAGRPYRGIPTISCTVGGDTVMVGGDMTHTSEAPTPELDRKAAKRAAKQEKKAAREAAEAAQLEKEAEEFAKKQEKLAAKKKKRPTVTSVDNAVGEAALNRVSQDARIREQNERSIKVLTDEAGFRISMLESERDIATYRFGGNSKNSKSRLGEIKKEIKLIHKRHKKALEAEALDNERYYSVACVDVQGSDFKRKRANKAKLEKLQNKLRSLLEERDSLNTQLTALYTGVDHGMDGVTVNEKWRSLKTAAAAKAYKKQKTLGRRVSRLPASSGEKKKLYDLMNNKIDASSSISLCKWRLKHEQNGRAEKKKIEQEIKLNEKRLRHIDQDIKFLARKTEIRNERAKEGSVGGTIMTILGIFLLIVVGFAIYVLSPASGSFGEGIRQMISGFIPPELKP